MVAAKITNRTVNNENDNMFINTDLADLMSSFTVSNSEKRKTAENDPNLKDFMIIKFWS